MIAHETHLQIGSFLFEGLDQLDLIGPFEVFSRLPNLTCCIFCQEGQTRPRHVRADNSATWRACGPPKLDLLHVPGGLGQEAIVDDEEILGWVQHQSAGAQCVFSVSTGALICGAAGLLKGRRATTHWSAFHLLPIFGAIPTTERVVVDGKYVFTAGVTAGIDGALGLLFLPLILGALSVRIFIEEATLRRGLLGYGEYTKRVRYRLVPGVW
jgi:cyclohexyl-isocyanide hydratase